GMGPFLYLGKIAHETASHCNTLVRGVKVVWFLVFVAAHPGGEQLFHNPHWPLPDRAVRAASSQCRAHCVPIVRFAAGAEPWDATPFALLHHVPQKTRVSVPNHDGSRQWLLRDHLNPGAARQPPASVERGQNRDTVRGQEYNPHWANSHAQSP